MKDYINNKPCSFYGSATVGSKGQVVIPQEAREAMGIHPGDKLVIIGMKDGTMLGMCTVDGVETFLNEMTDRLATIRKAIDTTKKES